MSKAVNTIRIGHPAYTGANAIKIVIGKAAAVRELRNRGVLRDTARTAVNAICKRIAGYATITDAGGFSLVEVTHWAGPAEGAMFSHGYSGLEITRPHHVPRQPRKNTTDLQCAGLVASIGCPRHLEICNEFGRTAPAGQLRYTECHIATAQRTARSRAAAVASGWVFEAAA